MVEPRVTMRVRPFEKVLTAENNALKCSGRIDGNTYVLNFGAGTHRLAIIETGSDQGGPYALIEESVMRLDAGFVLTVERNLEEPDFEAGIFFEPGCRIALTRPARVDLPSLGIDPETVNVIAPPDASVSIYFSAAGTVDGYSLLAFPDAAPMRPQ